MTTTQAPVLEVDGLSKSFGPVRALADVSMNVRAGELVALIGPNGAGKSTCFNAINGQLRPDGGNVRLDGTDVTGQAPHKVWRRGIGRTFQVAATFGSMSVAENVQMAMMSQHRRLGALWARATDLYRGEALDALAKVGMAEQAARPCAVLAYGDVKRVELAVALANRPRLLLMDEPTAGMAPAERAALMTLAVQIARDDEIAVLFTEHDMDVVFGHADRILVLHRGQLLAEGPPAHVRADPRVREVYLGGASADSVPGSGT